MMIWNKLNNKLENIHKKMKKENLFMYMLSKILILKSKKES